ncbi:antibiotic biosynthesis monooxygenase family protein [Kaarinaea lacus]
MIAVIFEVYPNEAGRDEYLEIAGELRSMTENFDGFISIERFQSLVDENKILSLSFWRDEEAVKNWRNVAEHRIAQQKGKTSLFESYRIRVAEVVRDYTDQERGQVPEDSKQALGQ